MDPLDELALVAPAEFVAARNRIVARLKQAGDTGRAAQVAKLRRPTQVQWAINMTVRERPDLAGEWARAAEVARHASGAELRTALAAVRSAAAALARAAGRHGSTGDVAGVLAAAAADPELTSLAAAGTLGLMGEPAKHRSPPRTVPPGDPATPRTGRAQAAVDGARVALAEAQEVERRAATDLAEAAAALDAARRAAVHAEREHAAAKRRHVAAERLVVDATGELAHAERRLAQVRGEHAADGTT